MHPRLSQSHGKLLTALALSSWRLVWHRRGVMTQGFWAVFSA